MGGAAVLWRERNDGGCCGVVVLWRETTLHDDTTRRCERGISGHVQTSTLPLGFPRPANDASPNPVPPCLVLGLCSSLLFFVFDVCVCVLYFCICIRMDYIDLTRKGVYM